MHKSVFTTVPARLNNDVLPHSSTTSDHRHLETLTLVSDLLIPFIALELLPPCYKDKLDLKAHSFVTHAAFICCLNNT